MEKQKIIFSFILIFSIFLNTFSFTSLVLASSGELTYKELPIFNKESSVILSRKEAFSFIANYLLSTTPKSYKYIDLKYTDLKKGTQDYENLQIIIYNDLLPNLKTKINLDKNISAIGFYNIVNNSIDLDIYEYIDKNLLKNEIAVYGDIYFVLDYILNLDKNPNLSLEENLKFDNVDEYKKMQIFLDVYKTILYQHYDRKIKFNDILDGAILGLTQGTGDKHTTYFPPSESKDFQNQFAGEFSGIGAYVEMETAGELIIISPINNSPALKSGLKPQDRILKIDDVEITNEILLKTAVELIKGKPGTDVLLKIQRGEEIFDVKVTREKIVINDVEFEVLADNIFYIQIKMFGDNVLTQFKNALLELKNTQNIKKVIIDVRNNPGGYLEQVNGMLGFMIEEGKPVSIINYVEQKNINYSKGEKLINIDDYDFYILQNSGTASASEILTGTLKDYFPEINIIGEKSYGKGSVQVLKEYFDGSTLKITIANWYTGKNGIGINNIGITPDIEIINLENSLEDEQLEYILKK